MAKTSYIDLTPEIESQYFLGLRPGDRYTFSRVCRKNTLLSQKSKKGITQKSLLPEISVLWAGLTNEERETWSAVGAESNMKGWNLFVQDYCARRVNGLSGVATPSLLHQSWVGQIHVESPATEVKLFQMHPRNYYIHKKILGTKSMYAPVLITEDFTLPLQISLNYSADLEEVGAGSFAKFYAKIWYSYQGVNRYQYLEIPLDYFTDWKTDTIEITTLETIVIRYDLYFHLYNLQGDLFIDNIKAEHSGQNWVRDPFCKDINAGFNRNYYQIPKHWTAEIAPEGVLFETVYKDF